MRFTLLQPSRCSWPVDWEFLYGRSAPFLVEIGFGNADFLIDLAKGRPEANVLGVEISMPSLRRGERKLFKANLTNLRLIKAKAESVFWLLMAPGTVQELYINYPDPWPKKAHHHRRLINDRFLELIASRMNYGARLTVATDHDDYATWITECLSLSEFFDVGADPPGQERSGKQHLTKYAKKAEQEGRINRTYYRIRNSRPIGDIYLIPKEHPMPHVVVKSDLTLNELIKSFQPWSFSAEGVSGRFIEMYHSRSNQALVIDTYVHEESLDQRVLLGVTHRLEGNFLIHLHEVGYPRPTAGLHRTVNNFSKWILALSEEGVILRSNLNLVNKYETGKNESMG